MGNNKFKLSNMFPNTFLYKLKYFNKSPPKTTPVTNNNKSSISYQVASSKTTVVPPEHCGPRKSYHFTRELQLPPPGDPQTESRKPTKESRTRFQPDEPGSRFSQNGSVKTGSSFDIVINVDEWGYKPDTYSMNGFGFKLPPIITKPDRPVQGIKPVGPVHPKGYSVKSPSFGVRLRINSPKIMRIKQGQNGNFTCRKSVKKRRSILESLVVVKSSDDPQRDFKESMVEMIVENNLKGSKDLEDLLACYLSLNSDEYHDVIIQVFKQIWFDLIR